MSSRLIELVEDTDTRRLSLSNVLALVITFFIIVLVILAMYDKKIDYTLIGFLMSGYTPYVSKQISNGLNNKKETQNVDITVKQDNAL